jgi:predicted Zn-ribbon and HTH transcriptional regulator
MTEQEKRIDWLERQLAQVKAFVARDKASLEKAPGDFSIRIALSSWESQRDELLQDLRVAKESLKKEVIELRLTGWRLDGSIPLRLLTMVSNKFHSAIGFAAFHLRYGIDPERGIPDELSDELDIRLSSLAPGSTRLLFAGSLSPDATGDIVLESALEKIFSLLMEQSPEQVKELVSTIGIRATRELCDLLKELEKRDIGAELTWPSPDSSVHKWGGTLDSVRLARQRLSIVSKIKPEAVSLAGKVAVLNDSGSIILRVDDGYKIKIEYNKQQYNYAQQYSLGMHVSLKALKYTSRDEITEKESSTYKLITD